MKYFILFSTTDIKNKPAFNEYHYSSKKLCESFFYTGFIGKYAIMGKITHDGKRIILDTSYPII